MYDDEHVTSGMELVASDQEVHVVEQVMLQLFVCVCIHRVCFDNSASYETIMFVVCEVFKFAMLRWPSRQFLTI